MNFQVIIFSLFFSATIFAQGFYKTPFAHTYSIVAIDTVTGEIGAAVQSHWFSVGSLVIWAESGVGATATQSFVNVSLGPRSLELMKNGLTAKQAGEALLANDPGEAVRQLAIIDANGDAFSHTGSKCIQYAGHKNGKFYSVQANLMWKETVPAAMEKAFLNTKGKLAERMMAALKAAEAEGGDIRGKQSAAMLVVRAEPTGNSWQDRLVDLRIEDHPEPIKELERLLKVHRAYEHMNAGDVAIEHGDESAALSEYGSAMSMFPDNLEMKYWTAVSLANIGKMDEALPLFKKVFRGDEKWRTLTPRLIPNELLQVSDADLKRIMNQ